MSSPADDQDRDPECEFCGIVSGRLPRTLRHQDDELIVFHNTLPWVPVMLLMRCTIIRDSTIPTMNERTATTRTSVTSSPLRFE